MGRGVSAARVKANRAYTVEEAAWATGVDLYSAGGNNYWALNIFPDVANNGCTAEQCTRAKHTVKIALNGANGSAGAGTATSPRLGICRIMVY